MKPASAPTLSPVGDVDAVMVPTVATPYYYDYQVEAIPETSLLLTTSAAATDVTHRSAITTNAGAFHTATTPEGISESFYQPARTVLWLLALIGAAELLVTISLTTYLDTQSTLLIILLASSLTVLSGIVFQSSPNRLHTGFQSRAVVVSACGLVAVVGTAVAHRQYSALQACVSLRRKGSSPLQLFGDRDYLVDIVDCETTTQTTTASCLCVTADAACVSLTMTGVCSWPLMPEVQRLLSSLYGLVFVHFVLAFVFLVVYMFFVAPSKPSVAHCHQSPASHCEGSNDVYSPSASFAATGTAPLTANVYPGTYGSTLPADRPTLSSRESSFVVHHPTLQRDYHPFEGLQPPLSHLRHSPPHHHGGHGLIFIPAALNGHHDDVARRHHEVPSSVQHSHHRTDFWI
jgi:hypothetical protein